MKIKKTKNSTQVKVNFEETNDGQMILNLISAAFNKVRKENQYVGETRIMQNLTRKVYSQFPEQQPESKVAEMLKRKEAKKSSEATNENLIPQIYRNAGYIRTSLTKNQ